MLPLLVLFFVVAATFYFLRYKNVYYWEKRRIPLGKGCNWFFGHYKPILFNEKHAGMVFHDMYTEFPDVPFVGYLKMSKPNLLVKDPDVIRTILSTEFKCFNKNELSVDKKVDFLFGHNPFVQFGEEWTVSRAQVSPSVTFAKLKNYYPTMLNVGDELVKYVTKCSEETGSAQIEVKNLAGMFTTDVVANAILGIENNTFENHDSLVAQLTREIFQSDYLDNIRIMLAMMFAGLNSVLRIRFSTKKSSKVLLSLTKKMMKEREESSENRTDLFQQVLAQRRSGKADIYTDEYIASQLYGFILDGYETASIVICYTLFELAWHIDIQEKLRTEVKEMISNTNGNYTVEHVEGLKYLDMVLNESLRLHVPLLVMFKECTTDYTFSDVPGLKQPLTIERGTALAIPVYSLHMDEKFYPSPKKFDPERFSEEEVAKRHKFVHLPFGEGPRKCLGQRFGVLDTKVAIIKTIEKFRLTPASKSAYPLEIDPQVFLLMRPLNGAWVQMQPV